MNTQFSKILTVVGFTIAALSAYAVPPSGATATAPATADVVAGIQIIHLNAADLKFGQVIPNNKQDCDWLRSRNFHIMRSTGTGAADRYAEFASRRIHVVIPIPILEYDLLLGRLGSRTTMSRTA